MDSQSTSKKRKATGEDSPPAVPSYVRAKPELEMLSDEEDEQQLDSDEEARDDFPELDLQSDSEEDDSVEGDSEDEEDDEEELSTDEDSDDSINPFPKSKLIVSDITKQPKRVYPEIEPDYDSDSSTEDDPNRVGNVPMHWYDNLPHIGYDMNGQKVLRPAVGDELDKFLATVDDGGAWTSAMDKKMQMDRPLTAEELDIIRRLHAGENPDAGYDPYEPTVEWFTGKGKEEIMPLSGALQPKRRWIPSAWEKKKVMKIVRAIRQGRIVPNKPKTTTSKFEPYAIWSETTSTHQPPLPAPKPRLPTTAESYNPPEEYLPTEEERKEWEALDPEDRERNFLPQKYSSLRLVPAFDQFIKQRFDRQLDLYLAPRIQRVKLNINPDSLIPKLPSPSSLKPFPNYRSLDLRHSNRAKALSVSPDGAWVVSGDEDGVVSLWEVIVGREVKRWKFGSKVASISWCPRTDAHFFAVGLEEKVVFIAPSQVSDIVSAATMATLAPAELPPPPETPSPVKWVTSKDVGSDSPILTLQLPTSAGFASHLAWHRGGNYLASVCSQGGVWIHQLTKRHSQAPFKKIKGAIQTVAFHPQKPHFFVATQQYVRIYNLAEQKLVRTLLPGIKWISSMDIHPSGDHLIVGGYDRKLCWFDLELSEKPYKVLRYHSRAIRSVQFHPTYPLFASSSDDGTIQVFHSRVYNDLMTDPLIVPLKILRGHTITGGLGVLQVAWTPKNPWLVSGGADGVVNVWCS